MTIKYNSNFSLSAKLLSIAATTQEAMIQYTNFVFFSILQILTLKVAHILHTRGSWKFPSEKNFLQIEEMVLEIKS